MKFLHLSDLHLGKTVNEISMIPDQKHMLRQVLDLTQTEKPDAVLIAGDVYDRTVPPEDAVTLLDGFLSELAAAHIPVLIISGNHDSEERLNFGSRLFEKNGIYICGKYDGTLHEVTLSDEHGPVHFWLMPYVQRALAQHFWPDDDTRTYETAARTILRHAEINFSERNVLLAHQFVTASAPDAGGSQNHSAQHIEKDPAPENSFSVYSAGRTGDPKLSGSEITAKNVGTIDRISSHVFDGFDYVALGHIHRPQRVGRNAVRYAGSPLKYSLSEADQRKAYTLVELGEKGSEPSVRLIPAAPLHDMRLLRGRLEDLMRPENILYPDDYVFVTLTDRTPVPDAFAIIQKRYPNAMGLRYDMPPSGSFSDDPLHGAGPDDRLAGSGEGIPFPGSTNVSRSGADPSGGAAPERFDDQIRSFAKRILGTDLTAEELRILRTAAREAGIENL